ncbi:MAG: gliding motility-associated C-terminal domain-containing protein [Saprospiraceae bacterium]|nr:gliding motility-associated C-terminal domain-containing protein [Saprospiraceae bacterium]
MNIKLVFSAITLILMCNFLVSQNIQFQKTYFIKDYTPGIKNIHTNFYDVEPLSDGGYVSLGFITDTFNFSEGIITKHDCLGNPVWSKTLGASGSPTNTNFGSVESDSGDIVFSFNLGTGFFRGSILAGRITAKGNVLWMKRIGNSSEFGRDIAKTQDGGFVIAGSTGQYGSDAAAADVYLLKLDKNGNLLWTKTFGNPGSTYDEAFSIKVDSKDNIVVAGRCIDESTFKAFILKTDPSGNPMGFKTFGYDNQRTYCFDLIVDDSDHYLITGSTTILEENHQSSEYDVFLIKTNSDLNPVFMNIFEVMVGEDRGSIGEGLALLPDGSYAIGVSTFAFTNHAASGPNAPNKNALYVITENGNLNKAFIYNMKGSQYTRVRTSPLGGVILSGFSTAYASNVNFQGLLIKTNEEFLSGCFDIDVTRELTMQPSIWTVRDFLYQSRSGQLVNNYSNYKDTILQFNTLCETTIELTPLITGPRQACQGKAVLFKDQSSGDPSASHVWIVNGRTFDGAGDMTFIFDSPGIHNVIRVMTVGCVSQEYVHSIQILPLKEGMIEAEICLGQVYQFNGKEIRFPGIYKDTIPLGGTDCDSVVTLTLSSNQFVDMGTIFDTIQCNQSKSYWNFNYNTSGTYMLSLKNELGCDSVIVRLQVYAFENIVKNEVNCQGIPFQEKDTLFSEPGIYEYVIKGSDCDQFVTLNFSWIQVDTNTRKLDISCKEGEFLDGIFYDEAGSYRIYKLEGNCPVQDYKVEVVNENCEDCTFIPNVFTPNDQDNRNKIFRPIIPKECDAQYSSFNFEIYNRWGKKVYSSSNVQALGWDGQQDGNPAPSDSYIYLLKYDLHLEKLNKDLKGITKKGVVSLIR